MLIFAQAISNFGDWLIVGILVSLINNLVPSNVNPALAIAGLWIAKIAPSLFFSPFIGAFVDRLDRKKGMIYSDVFRCLLVASLPIATVFGGIALVYLIIFLSEIFTLFFVPAKDASIPDLVEKEQILDANSLSFTVNQVTMLLGLSVGTSIIIIVNSLIEKIPFVKSLAGTYTAIYVDAFTFVLSGLAVALIHFPKKSSKVDVSSYHTIFDEVKDTFRFIADNPKIKSIIISAGFSVVGLGTILIIGPQYAEADLGMGREGFLILLTLLAFGLVSGAIASRWLTRMISKESLFSLSLTLLGLCLLVFALYAVVPVALTLSFIAGAALGLLYVSTYTMFHEQVSEEYRGRLFTALEADLRLALIISFLVTSAIASLIPDQTIKFLGTIHVIHASQIVLFTGGIIVLLVSVYAFKSTRVISKEAIIAKFKSKSS